MKKYHFDDLTEINCCFGLLDEDTQKRMEDCDEVQRFDRTKWVNSFTIFDPDLTYRQKPKPKTVTVYFYESNGTIFASSELETFSYSGNKLIATKEITLEEEEK